MLAVPVFVPAEAQLALARGAAIASTHGPEFFVDESGEASGREKPARRRSSPFPRIGAAGAMLGVGVVTFVVSGSLALGLQLTSGEGTKQAEKSSAASTSDAAAAVKPVQPAPATPPTAEAALPPAAPAELPPPSVYDVAPVPIADPVVPEVPAPDPLAPADGSTPSEGVLAANGVPLPPGVTDPAPGLVPAPVTEVPQQQGGILHRLKQKIAAIGQPDLPQAPVDPPPPAPDPLLVAPPADAPPPG